MARQRVKRISLSGTVGLRDAEPLRDQILGAFDTDKPVEVDCTRLGQIDMTVLQVFVAAQKLAASRNQDFKVWAKEDGPLAIALGRGGLASRPGFPIRWSRSASKP